VLYESDTLANILVDYAKREEIIGLILQPNEIELNVKANAIQEHYSPVIVEIMQQVKVEDSAENNEEKLEDLKEICKEVILGLIDSGDYKKIMPLKITKILETRYDANVIGWSMSLDLYYLKNENKC
jgi:tricorn protease-like protein